jgi:hypothetical protein
MVGVVGVESITFATMVSDFGDFAVFMAAVLRLGLRVLVPLRLRGGYNGAAVCALEHILFHD